MAERVAFKPKAGWSFNWMPACHDIYPGFRWIAVRRNMPSQDAFKVTNDELRMRQWGQGHIRVYAGKNYAVPEALREYVIWRDRDLRSDQPYVMVNAHDAPNKEASPKHKLRMRFQERGHKVFQDSGGFQIISGVKSFVDPVGVAHAHSRYANEGVGLDIPMASVTNMKLTVAAARVQVHNNGIIRKHLKPGVKLIEVSHGVSADSRKAYLDVLLGETQLDGLCIAGLRPSLGVFKPSLKEQALQILLVYLLLGKRTTRIHALGVSTYSSLILLSAAAKVLGWQLTADSARHILSGAGGLTLSDRLASVHGYEDESSRGRREHTARVFPNKICSCAICAAVELNFPYRDSQFLQTHAYISLSRAHAKADEDSSNYLSGVSIPYHPHMQEAIDILKTERDLKTVMTMLKEESRLQRKGAGSQLFTVGPEKALTAKITAAVRNYEQHYKKEFLK